MPVRRTRKDDGSQWTVADSRSVYGIRHWGAGYFAINEAGRVEVRPNGPQSAPIDLYEQVAELRKSGLSLPLLVRFPDILQDRVRQLTGAFDANIARLEYQSQYTALYPIKVNQQEAVIENIIATLQVAQENQIAARSRIVDADFAAETATLSRAQVLQQAGVAMLSQANASPNGVLSLLR